MDKKLPSPSKDGPEQPLVTERVARRSFLMNVGIALNAVVALAIATPVLAYLLGPLLRRNEYRQWIAIGSVDDFPPGETKLITFTNPFSDPWDGESAKVPAYVRSTSLGEFKVFAINCAHLGCPVRWFAESQLFMCPCHGGVYYADGSRASGPPERGLFTYELKVEGGRLYIRAGQLPTLRNRAALGACPGAVSPAKTAVVSRIDPCPGTTTRTTG